MRKDLQYGVRSIEFAVIPNKKRPVIIGSSVARFAIHRLAMAPRIWAFAEPSC